MAKYRKADDTVTIKCRHFRGRSGIRKAESNHLLGDLDHSLRQQYTFYEHWPLKVQRGCDVRDKSRPRTWQTHGERVWHAMGASSIYHLSDA